jgi:hypothetical protein
MDTADEAHCSARQRRLVVAEKRSSARQSCGYVVGAGLDAKISGHGEWRVGLAIDGEDISRAVHYCNYRGGWGSCGCRGVDDAVYVDRGQGNGCGRRGRGIDRRLRRGLGPASAADQENREHYHQDYGSGNADHQHVSAPLVGAACGHGFSQFMHWP